MQGFQIGEVFTESLRFLFKHLRAVFVLAIVPYGMLFGATLAAGYLIETELTGFELRAGVQYEFEGLVLIDPETGARLDFAPLFYYQLLMFVLALVIPLPFKVAWMRYSLLGPRYQPVRPVFSFGSRELRFLGYTLALMLIMLGIGGAGIFLSSLLAGAMASTGVAVALFLATLALLSWVTARLYFVFPPLIMDLPGGFGRAWAESRGQAFKLIILTLIIMLVLGLPTLIVAMLVGSIPIVGLIVMTVLEIVIDAGLWTALGFAYWKTTGIPGSHGPATESKIAAFD